MVRKTVLAIASILILLFLSALNIYHKVTWKEPTDGVTWRESENGLVATEVGINSQADLYGIRKGDILYSITIANIEEKIPTRTRVDVAKALWMAGSANQKVTYEIARPGNPIITPSFYLGSKGTSILYYFLAVIGFSCLIIGFIVFFNTKKPFSVPYLFYFLILMTFYSFHVFSSTGEMGWLDSIFYWLDNVAFLTFPPLLVHFFIFFPKRKRLFWDNRSFFYLYLPGMVILASKIFLNLPNIFGLNDEFIIRFYQTSEKLSLLHYAVYCIIGFGILLRDYLTTVNLIQKKQLKWILYGMGLGVLPFTFFYILPRALSSLSTNFSELSIVFNVLIPLTLAYSISRYKLMDLEMILKKAITLIFSFLVIAILYFVVSTQTRLFAENRSNVLILGILAIILGATLFTPLKSLIQSLLDRAIYKRSYQYRKTLLSISQEVSRERNLNKLSESILELTGNALSLDYISILLPIEDQPQSFYILKSRGEADRPHTKITFDKSIYALIQQMEFISIFDFPDNKSLQRKFAELAQFGFYHLMPLSVEEKLIGCLGMGKKKDGSYLTSEDMELMRTISPSVALALENAYLYNQASIRATELEQLKDYSENIIESLTVGVAVLDQRGRVTGWNRVLEDSLGKSREEVINRGLIDVLGKKNYNAIFPPDTQEDLRLMSEIAIDMDGGSKRIFDISKTPLLDNRGNPYGTIIVFEDITEKISLQQQLLTSEKLASIGLLSAGVAHEINTPLTGISSYVQMLQKKLADNPNVPLLEKIEVQTDRVGRIVKNLLNFARSPGEASFYQVDLRESLNEIIALIDYKLKNMNIALDFNLPPVNRIYAQGERLQQVFINIILNAIDAMPKGGTLSIDLQQTDKHIIIKIRDTGTGIKEQHLSHIFDPFFTTKGIGKGTGLGLSLSYAIIKEHEGQITVESEVGKGTLFTLSIPKDLDRRKTEKTPAPRTKE
jgi:two-component system NtrC family sensor kinase